MNWVYTLFVFSCPVTSLFLDITFTYFANSLRFYDFQTENQNEADEKTSSSSDMNPSNGLTDAESVRSSADASGVRIEVEGEEQSLDKTDLPQDTEGGEELSPEEVNRRKCIEKRR